MTDFEAIGILINYVDGDIVAGNFEHDPEYAKEIQAIKICKLLQKNLGRPESANGK